MNPIEATQAARRWIAADPDPHTRGELQALVDAGDERQLVELMSGALTFGTAGLRAAVGPGPLRMNRAVIRRTTAGVARYLLAKLGGRVDRPVVVGGDARPSSATFCRETIGVLAAHGLPVAFFTTPTPTPLAAYVARRLSASACIVVTASHNPKTDNGYKLYGSDAVQIVPPIDSEIAAEIARGGPANEETVLDAAVDGAAPGCAPVEPALIEAYYADVARLRPGGSAARDLCIAYTPLHGLGYAPVSRVLGNAGFSRVHAVESQRDPDGRFPTLAFPNPEEPGALDLLLQLAQRVDADLAIANDPDVDRLAAALQMPSGDWRPLSGNQLGLLLADFELSRASRERRPLVVQSVVSSPMLRSIAEAYDAKLELTLTGFKWIWTCALDSMRATDVNYVFGYEEALGYAAGQLVRDKDGIVAALLICELAALEKSRGGSLLSRLERLYRRHGLWVSAQRSAVREGLAGARAISDAMTSLRAHPPTRLADCDVTEVRDYRVGGESRPRWLGNANLVELSLGKHGRVLIRPSGTEPKLKCYVDLCAPLSARSDVWFEEDRALTRARELARAILNGLGLD